MTVRLRKGIFTLFILSIWIGSFTSCKAGYGCEATQEIREHAEKASSLEHKKRGKSKLFSKKQYKRKKRKS